MGTYAFLRHNIILMGCSSKPSKDTVMLAIKRLAMLIATSLLKDLF